MKRCLLRAYLAVRRVVRRSGLACLATPVHAPLRVTRHGGFRCLVCFGTFANLDDAGYHGDGYVAPLRRVFDRERHSTTRTTAWAPHDKRGW
jgi:hypothetical protein